MVFRAKHLKYLEAISYPLRVPSSAFSLRKVGAVAVNETFTVVNCAVEFLGAVQFPS